VPDLSHATVSDARDHPVAACEHITGCKPPSTSPFVVWGRRNHQRPTSNSQGVLGVGVWELGVARAGPVVVRGTCEAGAPVGGWWGQRCERPVLLVRAFCQ
jgi:hypothetical protein